MEQHKRAHLLCALFAIVAMLVLGGGALTLWQLPRLELRAARERWAASRLAHYRLDLRYGELGYCRQSIEVKNERVVAIAENTCSEPAPTVSGLFDQIEHAIDISQGRCGPNGCDCDGTLSVIAEYDPRLGYPRTKGIALEPLARWRYPDYWKRRLAGRLCSSLEFGREVITIVALKPIA
jgi:hypothetical protein